jgi:predicted dehydrogenase
MKAEIYDERWNPENEIHFSRIQNFLKNSTALTHEGSHVIDYAGLWNPSPWTSVSAFAQRTSPTFCGPNVWNAHVELADLSTLTVKVGWLLPQLPESTISVQGPAGQIHFNCVTGEGTYEIDSEREELIFRPAAPEWDRQYDAFADAIDRGTAVSATVNDALKALEVTAAGELSAQKGMQINRGELYKQAAAQQLGAAPKSATQMDNWLTA